MLKIQFIMQFIMIKTGLTRASLFRDTGRLMIVSSLFCDQYGLWINHAKFYALITFSTSKTFTKQTNIKYVFIHDTWNLWSKTAKLVIRSKRKKTIRDQSMSQCFFKSLTWMIGKNTISMFTTTHLTLLAAIKFLWTLHTIT